MYDKPHSHTKNVYESVAIPALVMWGALPIR